MAITVQRFVKLANYYNQTAMLMSAICVQKGGIAIENYVGRFYMADVLEYVLEYGRRLVAQNKNVAPEVVALINRLAAQFEKVKSLTTAHRPKPLLQIYQTELHISVFTKVLNRTQLPIQDIHHLLPKCRRYALHRHNIRGALRAEAQEAFQGIHRSSGLCKERAASQARRGSVNNPP